MEPVQAIILGLIQGLTEFLPVSSSGHLVLFQHLFGLKESALFFDVSVHMGTLIAVVIFFRKDIISIIVSLIRFIGQLSGHEKSFRHIHDDHDLKMAMLIIAGSVPTAIIGLLFKEMADRIFSSVLLVGCMLLLTGCFLWSTRWLKQEGNDISGFSIKNAFIIGIIQGLAILPGISRSGSTIVAGLFLNLNRETAARYSFLLSIPAIAGAEILSLKDLGHGASFDMNVLMGSVTACIVGYCALAMLVYIVRKGQMYLFSPYCWLVGIIALAIGW